MDNGHIKTIMYNEPEHFEFAARRCFGKLWHGNFVGVKSIPMHQNQRVQNIGLERTDITRKNPAFVLTASVWY